MGKVGLQLFSVWRDAEQDFLGTFQKVIDLGYEGVQFAGFFNTPAETVEKLLTVNKTLVAGAHVGLPQLLNGELERTLEYHHIIQNKLIVCPALPKNMRQTSDDYKKSAEVLNQIGEACKRSGFTFAYHNHDFEFQPFAGQTGLELLFDNTDSELVKMELDCYWASFAGHDPLEIIRNYKNRVVSLHIKDMKIENGKKRGTEIGNGLLDIKSLVQIGNRFGIEWFTVEQEEFDIDPYESLTINVNNLKKLLSEEAEK